MRKGLIASFEPLSSSTLITYSDTETRALTVTQANLAIHVCPMIFFFLHEVTTEHRIVKKQVLHKKEGDSRAGDTHQVRALRTKDIIESRPGGVEKPRI